MNHRPFVAPGLVVALAFGVSFVPPSTAGSGGGGQDRAAVGKPRGGAAGLASDRARAHGWLIVDGTVVPAPYAIEVRDDALVVNGHALYRPVAAAEPIDVPERYRLQHEVLTRLRADLFAWSAALGVAQARTRALDALRSDPLVADVGWESERVLLVSFAGESAPEHFVFDPDEAPARPVEEVRAEFLAEQAAALAQRLNAGALLVYQDGILFSTPAGRGEAVLAELESVAFGLAGSATREEAYHAILGDRDLARGLVERFSGR